MGAADLETRVAHLEQALLKMCAATLDLVLVVADEPPKGGLYKPTREEKSIAMAKAVDYVREAAEIVSGENAPRK